MGLFGGMFSRMYYGNPNQPELKRKDIERENRFKLFFTVLGVRFWPLVLLNLLFAVFWAPFLYLGMMYLVGLEQAIESLGLFMITATLALALQLTGPVWAGMVYVIRTWADDSHAEAWSDLWLGVKKNWKSGVLLNILNGLVMIFFVLDVWFYFSGGFGVMGGGILTMALGWLSIMCCLVWLMMNMIMLPMAVRYDLKLRQVIKNALLLTVAQLPRTLGVFLLAGGIFFGTLLLFFMGPSISPLLLAPFVVLGLSIPQLIGCSYANYLFDKYMKPKSPQAAE